MAPSLSIVYTFVFFFLAFFLALALAFLFVCLCEKRATPEYHRKGVFCYFVMMTC